MLLSSVENRSKFQCSMLIDLNPSIFNFNRVKKKSKYYNLPHFKLFQDTNGRITTGKYNQTNQTMFQLFMYLN